MSSFQRVIDSSVCAESNVRRISMYTENMVRVLSLRIIKCMSVCVPQKVWLCGLNYVCESNKLYLNIR